MPWKECSVVSERAEFVALALAPGVNFRGLCHRFGISHTTGYKWCTRAREQGLGGLENVSRRPHRSPNRCDDGIERMVLEIWREYPKWGGRKLRRRLHDLGKTDVPAASTITQILRRNGCVSPDESARTATRRFEHPEPNDLWQMDFKGEVRVRRGWCYPLTVLDDHSRFALGLEACPGPILEPAQAALTKVFRRYGLPHRMTMDNGSPWGSVMHGRAFHTRFAAWLMQLGIIVSHSRPRHPQTQGKDERFHRTLKLEVLGGRTWTSLPQCQREFDRWRDVYNTERPHEALHLDVPASHYTLSPRPMPDELPSIEYASDYEVRKVQQRGQLWFKHRRFWIGRAFVDKHVGIRPTTEDGLYEVYFCRQRIGQLDLREGGNGPNQV